jgi:membrane-bound inhibitor of C-type lysozyme
MTFRKAVFYIVIVILLVIVGYSVIHKTPVATAPVIPVNTTTPAVPVVSSTTYSCDTGSTIAASFTANSAILNLSDGRDLTLPQIVSADGAQYQQGNILFVTKGDQGFLQENGNTTYSNCIANASTTAVNGQKTFTDQGNTFTFSYPDAFTLAGGGIGYTENWKENADSTLGLILATVNVPQIYQPKTNFGDAKFTVGTSSDPKAVSSCLTDTSGLGSTKATATINGVGYTKIVTTDAGAGNRYETTSYRTVRNGQCYAIEYTIHYSVLANFDPSMGVTAFDSAKVHAALDGIMQSFKFNS